MQLSEFTEIKKMDEDRRIIYSEVYSPMKLDTYSDVMTAAEIEKMAHAFLQRDGLSDTIDTNHDLLSNGSNILESFIARSGDPDFAEGAWVVGIKVEDPAVWKQIKNGELSGLSMYGYAKQAAKVVAVDLTPASIGKTADNMGHDHLFFIEMDDDGRVSGGRTSMELDHTHEIKSGTATEISLGHSHRFYI